MTPTLNDTFSRRFYHFHMHQYIFPNFVTIVKRVFDCRQKFFCLFSKALVTVVKNFRNFTSLCVNITWNTR